MFKYLLSAVVVILLSFPASAQVVIQQNRLVIRPQQQINMYPPRYVYPQPYPQYYYQPYVPNTLYNRLYLQNQAYYLNQYYMYGVPPPTNYLQWRLYYFGY